MKKKIMCYILAVAGALLISVTEGFTKSGFGENVNSACTPDIVFTGDCTLCHTANYKDPTAARDAYKAGGTTLTDYFCPDNPDSNSLPKNTNLEPAGSGDFDGDGTPDILLRNLNNGRWSINMMAVGNTVISSTLVSVATDLNLKLAGIKDFDGDGKADILLRNTINGRWYMYLMNGTTSTPYLDISLPSNLNLMLAGIEDFDGDGNADILLRSTINGRWYLNCMSGATVLLSTRI